MDAVYIPMVRKELDDLRFMSFCWRLHPPWLEGAERPDVSLLLSLDTPLVPQDPVADMVSWFDGLGFRAVDVISADLSEQDAVYFRSVPDSLTSAPRLGLKSGPNSHFLFNQRYAAARKYRYVYQNEVDVFPMAPGWLGRLFGSMREDWLISGCLYRGPTRLGPKTMTHINGNAVLNAGHDLHARWLDFIETAITLLIEAGTPGPAFDTAPFEVLNQFLDDRGGVALFRRLSSVGLGNEDLVRELLQAMNYNPLMVNFTGGVEMAANWPVDFSAMLAQHAPKAVLAHSSMFRYLLLARILSDSDVLTFGEKQWLIGYCRRRLFPEGQKRQIHGKFVMPNPDIEKALRRSFLGVGTWKYDLSAA